MNSLREEENLFFVNNIKFGKLKYGNTYLSILFLKNYLL